MRKLIFLLTFLMLSCGGPKYIVKYEYIPPENNEGCLKKCNEVFNDCRLNCEQKKQVCFNKVHVEAQKVYEKELSDYEKALASYRQEKRNYLNEIARWNDRYNSFYRDYNYFKDICRKNKDNYACTRAEEIKEILLSLHREKPEKPEKPKKPDFHQILKELETTCRMNCSCQEVFDNCFTSCGGKLIPHRICIENCK